MDMKKILTLTFILVSTLTYTSCSNEEDLIFDKSAAERLNEASDLYSSRLMASPNGWAMQLYPTNDNEYPYGNGYLLLWKTPRYGKSSPTMDPCCHSTLTTIVCMPSPIPRICRSLATPTTPTMKQAQEQEATTSLSLWMHLRMPRI